VVVDREEDVEKINGGWKNKIIKGNQKEGVGA